MSRRSAPHDIVTPVPLGSRLSEQSLPPKGPRKRRSGSQWIPSRTTVTSHNSNHYKELYREFGTFIPKKQAPTDA